MLVLTRKFNEEVCIGDETRIKILPIDGNRVKLGIAAPMETPVFRGELVFERQDVQLRSERFSRLKQAGLKAG